MPRVRPVATTGIWIIGIAAYVGGLIYTLPATFIDARLESMTGNAIRLSEAQGTLWSGSGQLEIREQDRRIGDAHELSWHLSPGALLLGRLKFELKFGQSGQPFPLTVTWSRIELTNASIHFPAAALGLAVPKLSALALRGALSLRVDHLTLSQSEVKGDAVLEWNRAGSALTPVSPLGDYRLDIKSLHHSGTVSMRTLKGPLQIDGKGQWSADAALLFLGNARVPPQLQQQLTPLLRLIAVDRGSGNFDIRIQ